ncbi:pyrimidine 5 -nucleotidase [Tubulinosema ratisbonensis]|uniref:Pyrimidine 5-nucleotidase n=1 Tax=Tubulinosema ratisbonensis TaxID=291195 RepID=A0A437APC4_9MICR|nr:pyrimidine 5 -nucleotidase [Tubulinosema ratisbonensis]
MLLLFILKIINTKLVYLTKEEVEELKKTNTKNKKVFIFDLDDTLYDFSTPLENKHSKNKEELIEKYRKVKDVSKLSKEYRKEYGITLIGLLDCCSVEEILNESTYKTFKGFSLPKNDELKILLDEIKGDKWIFSNNQLNITENLLQEMGILENFEFVFGPNLNNYPVICKPFISAFRLLDSLVKSRKYSNVYFFDDQNENIEKGKCVGWESKLCNHRNILEILESFVD